MRLVMIQIRTRPRILLRKYVDIIAEDDTSRYAYAWAFALEFGCYPRNWRPSSAVLTIWSFRNSPAIEILMFSCQESDRNRREKSLHAMKVLGQISRQAK